MIFFFLVLATFWLHKKGFIFPVLLHSHRTYHKYIFSWKSPPKKNICCCCHFSYIFSPFFSFHSSCFHFFCDEQRWTATLIRIIVFFERSLKKMEQNGATFFSFFLLTSSSSHFLSFLCLPSISLKNFSPTSPHYMLISGRIFFYPWKKNSIMQKGECEKVKICWPTRHNHPICHIP